MNPSASNAVLPAPLPEIAHPDIAATDSAENSLKFIAPAEQEDEQEDAIDSEVPREEISVISTHIEARGLALAILATIASVFALQWAQKFFIPLLFGIFIAYTLNPLVVWLERLKVHRAFGTSMVMVAILCGLLLVCNSLQGEFQSILDELPASTHKISHALEQIQDGKPSAIEKMQAAAIEIENATIHTPDTMKGPKKILSDTPGFKVSDWLWAGSRSVAEFLGQATMVVFLVFFFLLSGDTFKRKLVKIVGSSISQKKITVQILGDINTSIQSYMFMLLVTNTILALLMWITLHMIGLQNAGAWAVVAGLLHVVPYFGPLLITASTGLSAFMQFESISMAMLVSGISLLVVTLVGTFITTWMTGRIARMNPAAVFISLLFWGWLWGIWGMLLGVPLVVILKVISERVEGMKDIAELLSD